MGVGSVVLHLRKNRNSHSNKQYSNSGKKLLDMKDLNEEYANALTI